MKALVFNGPGKIIYEDFPDPRLEDDRNMIIAVKKCSICGSDLHPYHGDHIGPRDYSQPMEPFCTGHEMIGEVVEVGKAVRKHRVGDLVMVEAGRGCGECLPCRRGQINLCTGYARGIIATAYGLSAELHGGHAHYVQVYNADLGAQRIPDGLTEEQAVLLTDALPTAYYGVKQAKVRAGDTVVVIGQGPVGLMAAEAAYAVGAARVYTVEPNPARRAKSAAFGAIPLAPEVAVPTILQDTKGVGVDAVIDAVGKEVTIRQALKLTRMGGHVAIVGIIQQDTAVPLFYSQMKSITIHTGIVGIASLWPELLPLLQHGRLKGENVFTHYFDLKDGAEAYRLFAAQADGVMKVMLRV
ncbi:MAG: theronine dehydrogenase [Bacteroidetes bacterium]|nr:MAG: theronine dehydrogenase [Bacteroidota bacterium]